MATRTTKKQQEGAASGEKDADAAEAGTDSSQERVKPNAVQGPGTGAASPVDEQDRMPSTTVLPTEAGPLVPTDVQKVHEPKLGHREASTDHVAANAVRRSVPGSNHLRIHGEDGEEIDVGDLFADPVGPSRMVEVKQRTYQTFLYPHASTPTTQLLWPAGAQVPLAHAEQFKAAVLDQQAEDAKDGFGQAARQERQAEDAEAS